MANRQRLFELDLDTSAVVSRSAELRKQIQDLKDSINELKKAEGDNTATIVKQEAAMKKLSSEYAMNQKALQALVNVNGKAIPVQEKANLLLEQETGIREESKLAITEITKIRDKLNVNIAEEAALIDELNKKLDEHNKFLKDTGSQREKQIMNIGNYKDSIKEAFAEINIFNGGLAGFSQRAKEAGGVGKLFQNSLSGMTKGIIGMTKASLAFIATPIGAILALLVGAFALVKAAMSRSEEATNKITKVFSIFSGIANKLLKMLEPLGTFLIDGIVAGFELVGKAAEKAMSIVSGALSWLGFDSAAESVNKFSKEMQEAAKDARDLADAEAKLEKEQRKAKLTQLEYQKEAEKLRQLRDDETKSIPERIRLNDQLGAVLKKQLEEELKIAQTALEVANLRIKAEGETKEALDAQYAALTQIADIQERITGQESEQLKNRISLQKEAEAAETERIKKAEEARQKAIDRQITQMEKELELYQEQTRNRERTGQELLEYEIELAEREKQILAEKLKYKRISQIEHDTAVLRLRNNLDEMQKDLDQAEIDRLKAFEQKKKEMLDELRLKREADEQERELLKAEMDIQKQVEALENLQLTEDEKTELMALIEENRGEIIAEIKRKYQEKELEDYKTFSAQQIALREQRAQEEIAIAKQVMAMFTSLLGDSLGAQLAGIAIQAAVEAGLVSITAASAAAQNLAQATAAAPPPFNAPFIATAVAQNAVLKANSTAAIAKILTSAALQGIGTAISSSKKFARGGIAEAFQGTILKGPSHSHGGIPTPFGEMEGNEAIINKRSTEMFKPILSAINVAGGGRAFAKGGIPNSSATSINTVMSSIGKAEPIDYDILAEKIGQRVTEGVAEANAQLPPNKLIIEEFNVANDNYKEVIKGASF